MQIERTVTQQNDYFYSIDDQRTLLLKMLAIMCGIVFSGLLLVRVADAPIAQIVLTVSGATLCVITVGTFAHRLRRLIGRPYTSTLSLEDTGITVGVRNHYTTCISLAAFRSYHLSPKVLILTAEHFDIHINATKLTVDERTHVQEWLAAHLIAGAPSCRWRVLPGYSVAFFIGVLFMIATVTVK